MIPTKADNATHERYVTNIIRAWNDATEVPNVVQAVTWSARRREPSGVGKRGNLN